MRDENSLPLTFGNLNLGCSKSLSDLDEGFSLCNESGPYFFEPSFKTFVAPARSNFMDSLHIPLQLENDLTFVDLNAAKVCLLEQHLGMIEDSLVSTLCGLVIPKRTLDSYYYQYVGLRMGGEDYIFVNAFLDSSPDSLAWKRNPYKGSYSNSDMQWRALFNLDQLSFEQFYSKYDREVFYEAEFPYDNISDARCIAIQDLQTFEMMEDDLCLLRAHLPKLEDVISTGCYLEGNLVNLSNRWSFQYMGVQKEGHRWIYINAFLELSASTPGNVGGIDWFYATFLPRISDGGRAVFGVFFDLETSEFMDLQFNSF